MSREKSWRKQRKCGFVLHLLRPAVRGKSWCWCANDCRGLWLGLGDWVPSSTLKLLALDSLRMKEPQHLITTECQDFMEGCEPPLDDAFVLRLYVRFIRRSSLRHSYNFDLCHVLSGNSRSTPPGPTSSRLTRPPRKTGSLPANRPSLSPIFTTAHGTAIASSVWMDPRYVCQRL